MVIECQRKIGNLTGKLMERIHRGLSIVMNRTEMRQQFR